MGNSSKKNVGWNFFSNYAHVLVCLTHKPQPTQRQMALQIGITERAVQRILVKLMQAGVISVEKEGRCNLYTIDQDHQLKHPLDSHRTIGEFIKLIDNEYQSDD